MTQLEQLRFIRGRITEEDALCAIAEEAAELAQAALKLRRAMTGTNPTPVAPKTAKDNVLEEIADVQVVCDLLLESVTDMRTVDEMYEYKLDRWVKRLEKRDAGMMESEDIT